jgi:hypothetical protein
MKNLFSSGKKTETGLFKKEKIFCIGLNKTGTTSIGQSLEELGYKMGNQYAGEMMLKDYAKRNFKPVLELCHTADAFQDAPFSFPYTFIILDHFFPNAKFILTVRDNADQWIDSLISFQTLLFGNGKTPTKETLQKAVYLYEGRPWEASRILFNTPEDDIYNREILSAYYNNHNANVRDYFRVKSNFLEINVADKASYKKMCAFLGKAPLAEEFQQLNKSR